MIHSQFLDCHDRLVQSIKTPFGNLVEQFPVGCVVTELHGASQRTGKVVDHRPMRDRTVERGLSAVETRQLRLTLIMPCYLLGREGTFECLELPGGNNALIGVIPLEALGLEPD